MARQIWRIPEPPQFLEYDEVRRIIDWVSLGSRHKYRDVLLLEAMWETGARVSEVLMLTPEGIGQNSIILPNLKQKRWKRRGDMLPHKETIVSSELCQELKTYTLSNKISERTPVFRGNRNPGKSLNRRYVHRLITKAADECWIIKSKKMKSGPYAFTAAWPHLLRHSAAMFILDSTNDLKLVQRQLGHSSIVTTEMYASIRPETAKKGLSEIDWRGGKI